MSWIDIDKTDGSDMGSSWEAYMFEGVMAIGSSADPLIIYGEK